MSTIKIETSSSIGKYTTTTTTKTIVSGGEEVELFQLSLDGEHLLSWTDRDLEKLKVLNELFETDTSYRLELSQVLQLLELLGYEIDNLKNQWKMMITNSGIETPSNFKIYTSTMTKEESGQLRFLVNGMHLLSWTDRELERLKAFIGAYGVDTLHGLELREVLDVLQIIEDDNIQKDNKLQNEIDNQQKQLKNDKATIRSLEEQNAEHETTILSLEEDLTACKKLLLDANETIEELNKERMDATSNSVRSPTRRRSKTPVTGRSKKIDTTAAVEENQDLISALLVNNPAPTKIAGKGKCSNAPRPTESKAKKKAVIDNYPSRGSEENPKKSVRSSGSNDKKTKTTAAVETSSLHIKKTKTNTAGMDQYYKRMAKARADRKARAATGGCSF